MKRFCVVAIVLALILTTMTSLSANAADYIDLDNNARFSVPYDWEEHKLFSLDQLLYDEERASLQEVYQKYDVLYRVWYQAPAGVMLYGSAELASVFPETDSKEIDFDYFKKHCDYAKSAQTVNYGKNNYLLLTETLSKIYICVDKGCIYQFEFKGASFDESTISALLSSASYFYLPSQDGIPDLPTIAKTKPSSSSKSSGSGSPVAFVFILGFVGLIIVLSALKRSKDKRRAEENDYREKFRYSASDKKSGASFSSKPAANFANRSEQPLSREQAAQELIKLVTEKGLKMSDAKKRLDSVFRRCPKLSESFPLDEKDRFLYYACHMDYPPEGQKPSANNYYTLRLGGSGYQVECYTLGDLLEYSVRIVDHSAQVYIAYVDDWGLLYNYDVIPLPDEVVADLTPENLIDWIQKTADPHDYSIENDFDFSFAYLKENRGLVQWCNNCRKLASVTPKDQKTSSNDDEEMIDDISFISQMKQSMTGPWCRYDIVLGARPYGWSTAVLWASYMATADLEGISTVTTAPIVGGPETERIDEYAKAEKSIEKMPSLETESGVLSIGGISKALKAPVKIAFYNQTKMITLMTLINDEDLMNRYAETAIRRTFGTPDEMKRAKPYPRQDQ